MTFHDSLRDISTTLNWEHWQSAIPLLQFPSDWYIRLHPPFGGAMVRFTARKGEAEVSVYLDCHKILGSEPTPYWEIYPAAGGDTARFALNDTPNLLSGIAASLAEQLTPPPLQSLWLLEALTDHPFWIPWYDKTHAQVIRASSEDEARTLAQVNAGDETTNWKGGERQEDYPAWLSPSASSCTKLDLSGPAAFILSDHRSA